MFYLLVCYISVNIPQCTDMELIKFIIKPILLLQLDQESVRGEKFARSSRLNNIGPLILLLPADESRPNIMQWPMFYSNH
jgi:hypothetical protein